MGGLKKSWKNNYVKKANFNNKTSKVVFKLLIS